MIYIFQYLSTHLRCEQFHETELNFQKQVYV